MEKVTIYKFQLETILEALRITSNIHNCSEGKTCFDRQVRQAYEYSKNALEGNKKNNCKNNLEWCTDSDNKKHAYKTGLMTPGNQYSKRIKQDLPRYKLKSTNFN